MQMRNGWDSQTKTTPYERNTEGNVFCLQLREGRQSDVGSCPLIDWERPGKPAEARWRVAGARRRLGNGSGSEQGERCWQKFKEPRSYLNVNRLVM
ncbi:hypothetical protein BTVI_16180 [Pitangus sulphuratus]|nr:hypothetical protein BTVI_16180 [Pitangus sulphuratus]